MLFNLCVISTFLVFLFFFFLFFFINSASGVVYRLCSNDTIANIGSIASYFNVECNYERSYVIRGDNRVDFHADTCEACIDSDGCNGASQYGPLTVMIAIPMALMKILSF